MAAVRAGSVGRERFLVALLILAALIAAWIPAHRASRVDPLTSLRGD